MESEKSIAKSLIDNSVNGFYGEILSVDIEGVNLTFPFQDVAMRGWNEPVPSDIYENFSTMKGLFSPENIPQRWLELLREVEPEKVGAGNKTPTNLIAAVHFISVENPRYQELGISKFENSAQGVMDLSNKKDVVEKVNAVLDDPSLRQDLKRRLIVQEPDVSAYFPDNEEIFELLERLGIKCGTIVDFGCGTGSDTDNWLNDNYTLLGLDRQYHPEWYDVYWKNKTINAHFFRSDFMEMLPLASNSVDLGVMTNVVIQTTEEGLAKGLREIRRVIKEGGILAVGPQSTEDYSSWVVLRKEGNKFVEYSVSALKNLLKDKLNFG